MTHHPTPQELHSILVEQLKQLMGKGSLTEEELYETCITANKIDMGREEFSSVLMKVSKDIVASGNINIGDENLAPTQQSRARARRNKRHGSTASSVSYRGSNADLSSGHNKSDIQEEGVQNLFLALNRSAAGPDRQANWHDVRKYYNKHTNRNLTVEELNRIAGTAGKTKIELINGEFKLMMQPLEKHGQVVRLVCTSPSAFLRSTKMGATHLSPATAEAPLRHSNPLNSSNIGLGNDMSTLSASPIHNETLNSTADEDRMTNSLDSSVAEFAAGDVPVKSLQQPELEVFNRSNHVCNSVIYEEPTDGNQESALKEAILKTSAETEEALTHMEEVMTKAIAESTGLESNDEAEDSPITARIKAVLASGDQLIPDLGDPLPPPTILIDEDTDTTFDSSTMEPETATLQSVDTVIDCSTVRPAVAEKKEGKISSVSSSSPMTSVVHRSVTVTSVPRKLVRTLAVEEKEKNVSINEELSPVRKVFDATFEEDSEPEQNLRDEVDSLNAEVEKNKGELMELTRRVTAELNAAALEQAKAELRHRDEKAVQKPIEADKKPKIPTLSGLQDVLGKYSRESKVGTSSVVSGGSLISTVPLPTPPTPPYDAKAQTTLAEVHVPETEKQTVIELRKVFEGQQDGKLHEERLFVSPVRMRKDMPKSTEQSPKKAVPSVKDEDFTDSHHVRRLDAAGVETEEIPSIDGVEIKEQQHVIFLEEEIKEKKLVTIVEPTNVNDDSVDVIAPNEEMPTTELVLDEGVTVPDLDSSRSGKKLKKDKAKAEKRALRLAHRRRSIFTCCAVL